MKKAWIVTLSVLILIVISISCNTKVHKGSLSEDETKEYLEKGKLIAGKSFATFSSHLMNAMKEGGVQEAAKYCNIYIYPLTDSLTDLYDAKIRRTSLKIRNLKNNPTEEELSVLKEYQSAIETGIDPLPKVTLLANNSVAFYAPIKIISPVCLKCHGELDNTLLPEDYAFIKKYYPRDQAIGYKMEELRGIWSIEFER